MLLVDPKGIKAEGEGGRWGTCRFRYGREYLSRFVYLLV